MQNVKVGIDEVGKGAWAGPMYLAGVCAPAEWTYEGLRDSKKLSKPRIYAIAADLITKVDYHIQVIEVSAIDEYGIGEAWMDGCRALAQHFREHHPECFIEVDGDTVPSGVGNIRGIVDGDALVPHIMAASIIAKAARDRCMREFAETYPHYAWEKNAGYGVAAHVKGLEAHGVTPLHRTSFKPIRQYLAFEVPSLAAGPRRVSSDVYADWRKTGGRDFEP